MISIDKVREEAIEATNRVLDELAKRYTRIYIQPGEVTIKMVAEKLHVSETTAYNFLKLETDAGRMIEIEGGRASKNGKNARVWKMIEPPDIG